MENLFPKEYIDSSIDDFVKFTTSQLRRIYFCPFDIVDKLFQERIEKLHPGQTELNHTILQQAKLAKALCAEE